MPDDIATAIQTLKTALAAAGAQSSTAGAASSIQAALQAELAALSAELGVSLETNKKILAELDNRGARLGAAADGIPVALSEAIAGLSDPAKLGAARLTALQGRLTTALGGDLAPARTAISDYAAATAAPVSAKEAEVATARAALSSKEADLAVAKASLDRAEAALAGLVADANVLYLDALSALGKAEAAQAAGASALGLVRLVAVEDARGALTSALDVAAGDFGLSDPPATIVAAKALWAARRATYENAVEDAAAARVAWVSKRVELAHLVAADQEAEAKREQALPPLVDAAVVPGP